MAIVRCPKCHNEQLEHEDTRYCYMDGAKMEPLNQHSDKCSYKPGKHDKFCPRCGEKLEASNAA